jgi:hypothetical protein
VIANSQRLLRDTARSLRAPFANGRPSTQRACFNCPSFQRSTVDSLPSLGSRRAPEAQKCLSVTPLLGTLTNSLSRKSFPCHSYTNTRDRGVAPPKFFAFTQSDGRDGPLPLNTFRINTCKSVSKQTTLTSFGINTYEKPGGGGPPCVSCDPRTPSFPSAAFAFPLSTVDPCYFLSAFSGSL